MFQDVLLQTTPQERRRRRLTLGITLLGESLVVAALVAIPLFYLDALPGLAFHEPSTPVSLSRTPHVAGGVTVSGASHPSTNTVAVVRAFNPHPALPYGPVRANDAGEVTAPTGNDIACCGDGPSGIQLFPTGTYVPPVLKPAITGPRQLSHLQEGMIIKRVDPVYPTPAKFAGVEGEVTLRATIGTSGQLEGLQVVSGNPLLVNAAVAAVQQWRFKPYVLNGSPIEVQSQITVKFVLQR